MEATSCAVPWSLKVAFWFPSGRTLIDHTKCKSTQSFRPHLEQTLELLLSLRFSNFVRRSVTSALELRAVPIGDAMPDGDTVVVDSAMP